MDIYTKKSNWKIVLGVMGLLILVVTIVYSNYLAERLKENEEKNKRIFINSTLSIATKETLEDDITMESYVQEMFVLPSIIEYEDGILGGINWGDSRDDDQEFLKKKVAQYKSNSEEEPIIDPIGGTKVYIFNSALVQLIKYYPLVQALLVGLFIALGYYLFNTARSSEQNQVWAGMAKETAHQLGTPISAILAWIEHLKMANENDPEQLEILDELAKDVDRLELIADRFSKIGSLPELEPINIYDQLDAIKDYMQRRASRRVVFNFPENAPPIMVNVNQHLFSWVLENLIRNSLDAMDGQGEIGAQVYDEGDALSVDLSDTGKGIQANKFKTVFEPGFSTKMRGWGLGLSLAKRIIENYHKGKIFVKNSKIDEGTTFTIRLPKAAQRPI
jgi:signal transduction histidine kinase